MAQVIIEHPDGRRYEVSEQAHTDLYEPFGFEVVGVLYNGTNLPYTEANLARANEAPTAEVGNTTAENAARSVILSDLEAEARQRLAAEKPVGFDANAGTNAGGSGMEVVTPNAVDTSGSAGGESSGESTGNEGAGTPPKSGGKAAKAGA
jgi:hypothetical protein